MDTRSVVGGVTPPLQTETRQTNSARMSMAQSPQPKQEPIGVYPPPTPPSPVPDSQGSSTGPGRGVPLGEPWVSYYGGADGVDLDQVADTFRIINIDADPGAGNFTAAQIGQLKADGRNRIISYLNLGAVERSRSYWSTVPKGFVAPRDNSKAQLGPYAGYPDEVWMNVGDPDWQRLIVDYLGPRLVAQGVDGFYFDNLEIVEHDPGSGQLPPCDARCSQGGLDLVAALRASYPNLLFVMQNATSDRTRLGTTDSGAYAALLDGVAHEEVFTTADDSGTYHLHTDEEVVNELVAWQHLNLTPGGRPLWIATEDYVNNCANASDAQQVYFRAHQHGFAPYASDASAGQNTICYWPFTTTGTTGTTT
jgi:cysteinyl-tRNA synthetase